MKKFNKFSIILTLVLVLSVAFTSVDAFAAPKKSAKVASTKKVTTSKKTVKKPVVKSTTTKKTVKKPVVKRITSKKPVSRGGYISFVSGSGTTLGSADRDNLVAFSKQFIGTRYVSGGSSPSGFDCSGFTSYVFSNYGISLPRTASGQARVGVAVSRNELQKGDLVFFQTFGSGISHVAIYIGDGKIIHAQRPGQPLEIASLSESYFALRYRGATRVIN